MKKRLTDLIKDLNESKYNHKVYTDENPLVFQSKDGPYYLWVDTDEFDSTIMGSYSKPSDDLDLNQIEIYNELGFDNLDDVVMFLQMHEMKF